MNIEDTIVYAADPVDSPLNAVGDATPQVDGGGQVNEYGFNGEPVLLTTTVATTGENTVGEGESTSKITLTKNPLTIGNIDNPVYIKEGNFKSLSEDIGYQEKEDKKNNTVIKYNWPVNIKEGKIKAINEESIGSNNTFMYLDSEKGLQASNVSVGFVKDSKGTFKSVNHAIVEAGEIKNATGSDYTIGANNNPMYMSEGVFKAMSSTVGSVNQPVYLDKGVITAGNVPFGITVINIAYSENPKVIPKGDTTTDIFKKTYIDKGKYIVIARCTTAPFTLNIGGTTYTIIDSSVVYCDVAKNNTEVRTYAGKDGGGEYWQSNTSNQLVFIKLGASINIAQRSTPSFELEDIDIPGVLDPNGPGGTDPDYNDNAVAPEGTTTDPEIQEIPFP